MRMLSLPVIGLCSAFVLFGVGQPPPAAAPAPSAPLGFCLGCEGFDGPDGSTGGPNGTLAIVTETEDGDCDWDGLGCSGQACESTVSLYWAIVPEGCHTWLLTSQVIGQQKIKKVATGCGEGNGEMHLAANVACGDGKKFTFTMAGMTTSATAYCSACN